MIKIDKSYIKSQIDPSVLTPKSDLYPKIWNPSTKKLNDNIKIKLKQIAEDFIRGFKHPLKIKDIILTGSIANYNWNQYSDIDLHVLIDFNEIPDEHMEAFKDYFNAKKEIWNKTHNIMIMGHEVEVYIQDTNETHFSSGVYSIFKNDWTVEPRPKEENIDYDDIIKKTEHFIQQISKLSELMSNKDYQKAKIGIDNLKNKIKRFRQAGLETGGEYSTENLVFKMLRNQGYLEQLSNMKNQAYDSDMGIEEEILRFQETLEEAKKKKKGKKDACYYKAKAKYKVWPSAYASGYLVKCRKKKGRIKEEIDEELEIDEILLEDLLDEIELDEELLENIELDEKWSEKYKRSIDCKNPKGFSQKAHCQGKKKDEELELDEELIQQLAEQEILDEKKKRKTDFSKEKSKGLHGWFSRQGGSGKSKGWVDCNTCRKDKSTGRKKCKSCGRQKGEKRGKYPACRPTPSACTRKGMKNKKSSKQVSWKSKKEK